MDILDLIRRIASFVLLVAAVIALVGFFIGSGTLVFKPIGDAIKPFNFEALGAALYNFISILSVPLIMVILGLIGLTMKN